MEDARLRAAKYRNKAEELRAVAASSQSLEAQRLFLEMADDYIHMAELLERNADLPLRE